MLKTGAGVHLQSRITTKSINNATEIDYTGAVNIVPLSHRRRITQLLRRDRTEHPHPTSFNGL